MEAYIGTKIVEAESCTLEFAEHILGRNICSDNALFDGEMHPGYLVKYLDGYKSWSPAKQFEDAYKLYDEQSSEGKSLDVTCISDAKAKVSDIKVVGSGDMFQLLCKASSASQGWMKSAKACEIPDVGCIVQVTTQNGSNVAEAVAFVPRVGIVSDVNGGRKLVSI